MLFQETLWYYVLWEGYIFIWPVSPYFLRWWVGLYDSVKFSGPNWYCSFSWACHGSEFLDIYKKLLPPSFYWHIQNCHKYAFTVIPILEHKFLRVLLRPRKSHETTVGILPNKRSQLAHYCLVWGVHLVCNLATIGQATVKACFTSRGSIHHLSVFFSFMFRCDMQVPR